MEKKYTKKNSKEKNINHIHLHSDKTIVDKNNIYA